MPRVANPLTKVRKRLEACCFAEIHFKNLPKDKDKATDPDKHRNLYRTKFPIQRETVPAADEALDIACERLGLDRTVVHGFVDNNPKIGASCYAGIRGNAVVLMTSGAIERFTIPEMTYVFGHELGHYILPDRGLIGQLPDGMPSSMEDAILHRKLEISMDRFGMVACQDFKVAAVAFMKLNSGLSAQHITDDVVSYAKEAIRGYVEDHSEYIGEAYSTHPTLYARIRALSHYSESEEYLKLIGKKGGKPQAEVDAEVEKDLHATLDYYAGKLMDDVIGAVNNHLAAAQVHFEGKCDLSRYAFNPKIKPEENVIRAIVGEIQEKPADKRDEDVYLRLSNLIRQSVLRCPYRMHQHLEALLPRLADTKFNETAQKFAKSFKDSLIKHRSGEQI
jgi:hypothetical protein